MAVIHQIGSTSYNPTDITIDMAISADPAINLLRFFIDNNAGVNIVHIHNTVYLLAPFVRIFLEGDFIPIKYWYRIQGDIVDLVLDAYF